MDGHWLYIVAILAIVLIFWGPKRLPEFGAGLGRGIKEFRNAMQDVTHPDKPAASTAQGTQEVTGTPQPVSYASQDPKGGAPGGTE